MTLSVMRNLNIGRARYLTNIGRALRGAASLVKSSDVIKWVWLGVGNAQLSPVPCQNWLDGLDLVF